MSLQRILTNELLNTKLIEISRDEVSELHKYVSSFRSWCPDVNIEACSEFIKLLDEVSVLVSRLRLFKLALYEEIPKASVDSNFLSTILDIVKQYYKLLIHGLVDGNGNVYVKVLRDVCLGGITHSKGVMTYMPVMEALLLSRLGFVKVMDDVIK